MVEKDAVRQGYDEVAVVHDEERDEDGPGSAILDTFLDSLDDPTRILDAGCGSGRPVLRRLTDVSDAVGLDISAGQLRLARENAPAAGLLQGDMTTLPFPDDSFDAVVAFWSLIHVPEADHQAVLDEFARVLRPGGRALVCEAAEAWNGENPDWLDEGVEMQWNMAGAQATRDQLETAGFDVEEVWGAPTALDWDRRTHSDDEAADVEDEPEDDAEDDSPWTFFAARLGSQ
ncbi:class I SAM-dependent methyltransferase [Haloarchaeobius sp. HME9146]|uniref:class I SAM-dependent methyltransferase n=1 Tax=Haloarchaeobius sp. HME9146 TaxID=2978732 RepID=UPI0021BEF885|nr:class I SAM-dependent methyltransferase [Haloarchaeobius sp. HME9146]MCT9096743.1 class I SAM-dependent methyltransferase [Haloarchaeobius sp. HME9146]